MWFKISSRRGIIKGEDLEQLTREIQSPCWKKLSTSLDTVTIEARRSSTPATEHDAKSINWKSSQANEFLQAIAAIQCRSMEIRNFLDVPLPILQTCLEQAQQDTTTNGNNNKEENYLLAKEVVAPRFDSITIWCTGDSMRIAIITNTARTANTTRNCNSNQHDEDDSCRKPLCGTRLSIEIDTQSIHWADFWVWLETKTSFCHVKSSWKHLEIHLHGRRFNKELQDQCSHSLERLLSTALSSLAFHAPDLLLVSSSNNNINNNNNTTAELFTLLIEKQQQKKQSSSFPQQQKRLQDYTKKIHEC